MYSFYKAADFCLGEKQIAQWGEKGKASYWNMTWKKVGSGEKNS